MYIFSLTSHVCKSSVNINSFSVRKSQSWALKVTLDSDSPDQSKDHFILFWQQHFPLQVRTFGEIYNFVFFSIFIVCLNSVTLSLYLSITLVRARCYHNECICLMCSVGEVQEVDSRLTCYNLSCCYARKRWRV